MAVNAPRTGGIRPFSGGPLGIGWAPWAIGAAALAVGLYLFTRRGAAAAAQPAALPLTSQPSVNVNPFPDGGTNSGSNPSAAQLQRLPGLVWQYGSPPANQPYVWRFTGTNPPPGVLPGQVFPGSSSPANNPGAFPGGGAYSWQWSPIPPGQTDVSYIQALANPSATQMANFAA